MPPSKNTEATETLVTPTTDKDRESILLFPISRLIKKTVRKLRKIAASVAPWSECFNDSVPNTLQILA